MTVTSFAVVAFFRARPDRDAGPWRTFVAPLIAGVLMLVVLVLGVTNFNVLITSATGRADGHDGDRAAADPARRSGVARHDRRGGHPRRATRSATRTSASAPRGRGRARDLTLPHG